MPTPTPSRTRLLQSTMQLLQHQGLAQLRINEVLELAAVPRGVLYHHFPKGKNELACTALQALTTRLIAQIDRAAQATTPLQAIEAWIRQSSQMLVDSDFQMGCPLATTALETAPADAELKAVLATCFDQLRVALAGLLQQAGLPEAPAQHWATVLLSSHEGNLMLSRVSQSPEPFQHTMPLLMQVLRQQCAMHASAS